MRGLPVFVFDVEFEVDHAVVAEFLGRREPRAAQMLSCQRDEGRVGSRLVAALFRVSRGQEKRQSLRVCRNHQPAFIGGVEIYGQVGRADLVDSADSMPAEPQPKLIHDDLQQKVVHSSFDCGLRIADCGSPTITFPVFFYFRLPIEAQRIRNPQRHYRRATVVPEIRSGRVRRDALSHAARYNGKHMNTIDATDARSVLRQSVTGRLSSPVLTSCNLSSAIPNVRPANANITV